MSLKFVVPCYCSRVVRVLGMVSLLVGAAFASSDEIGKQPNVVLIMADDLGIEGIGCYGGESYSTPNIDRMAEEGMCFTHGYSQPLCTPTRLQIMTGKYNHRNWEAFGILPKGEKTFGHMMQDFGYTTCIAGKWQLTSYDPPEYPGAELRRGTGMHPRDAGFDEYLLFHAEHTEDKGSRYADPTYLKNGKLHKEVKGKYGEDVSVEFILDFIERKRSKPFFVYYPMALPHGPFNPTPHSEVWEMDPEKRLDDDVIYFGDMVEYMDHTVGRILDHLESLNLERETIVLFYSDNGTPQEAVSKFRGREIQGGKNRTIQEGIRVPLLAWWPGMIEAGSVSDDLVDASDFLPTLAQLAGKAVPESWESDGYPFVDRMFGKATHGRDWAFFWYDPRPGWDKDQFRQEIFALDHRYKLFDDGRFYDIQGDGLKEQLIDPQWMDEDAERARAKLRTVIDRMLEE